MTFYRRDVLVGSLSSAIIGLTIGNARSETAPVEHSDEVSKRFGLTNYRNGGPDLSFPRKAQEERTKVPLGQQDFDAYLDNLPILRRMRAGESREFYHLMQWNAFALDLTSQDHTTVAGATDFAFAEQYGPHRSSRALAIAHLAIFEAVNAVYKTHKSYKGLQSQIVAAVGVPLSSISPSTASVRLAIGYAAYDTLSALYPKKQALINSYWNRLIPIIGDGDSDAAKLLGAQIGQAAAKAVLLARKYDYTHKRFDDGSRDGYSATNSLALEPSYGSLFPSPSVADWQIDPCVSLSFALGGHWSDVTPFVLPSNAPFQLPGPPDVNSAQFKKAYDDVRNVGGDPAPIAIGARYPTGTTRTGTNPNDPLNAQNETFKGQFWGYDGSALLCAPPRLYNMVATSIALHERPITKVEDMAFFLALVNITMADAGVAAWTAKYHYHFARPVTYIRQVNPNDTILGTQNAHWTPLGGPDTNGQPDSSNFTPPSPPIPPDTRPSAVRCSRYSVATGTPRRPASRVSISSRTNITASIEGRKARRARASCANFTA